MDETAALFGSASNRRPSAVPVSLGSQKPGVTNNGCTIESVNENTQRVILAYINLRG